MSAKRVFLYVQHLLGIGHLKRAVTLARAMADAGLEVTLASGGHPVPQLMPQGNLPDVRFVQLPPASAADPGFKILLDETGRQTDAAWRQRRSALLQSAWRESAPDVLVIELFPFGRRQMRFELLPLLDAAAAAAQPPAVVCSVRDVLGGAKSPERQEETLDLVERRFDRVLVHGDPGVIPFETTFPGAARIAARIEYTGYVVDPARTMGSAGTGEVIVSAGGGAVGARLLESALLAKPLTLLRGRTWRVLAGNNLPDEEFQAIARLAERAGGVALERSRPDFTTLLSNCELSISQGGYNTLLEVVQARARAVVVPFAGGQETEQTLRACCFAARGLLAVVEESALSPESLAAAIDLAARKPRPLPGQIALDGAKRSAQAIARLAAAGAT
ncbi:MAG: glycosyl transferase [Candidatus Parcubacteria bacterium]|nr:glycosyl transferase [Burkholderiales bacterium]